MICKPGSTNSMSTFLKMLARWLVAGRHARVRTGSAPRRTLLRFADAGEQPCFCRPRTMAERDARRNLRCISRRLPCRPTADPQAFLAAVCPGRARPARLVAADARRCAEHGAGNIDGRAGVARYNWTPVKPCRRFVGRSCICSPVRTGWCQPRLRATLFTLLPDIEIGLIEQASHAFLLEDPHGVAGAIQAFLHECGDD